LEDDSLQEEKCVISRPQGSKITGLKKKVKYFLYFFSLYLTQTEQIGQKGLLVKYTPNNIWQRAPSDT